MEVVFEPAPVLDATTRAAFLALLGDLPQDVAVLLIRSGSRAFAGVSALPRSDDAQTPDLAALCAAIAAARKPVVFLIEGLVNGALAEVALAASVRLATPEARILVGAPDLGLIPGAGATQRLAARIGAEQALRVMRGGIAVAAPEGIALGLVDTVIIGKDREDVWAQARDAALAAGARDQGIQDGRAYLEAVQAARATQRGGVDSALIDCVEAALLLPPDQALAYEASVAATLAQSPEAAALCHIHRAELAAALTPVALDGFAAARVVNLGLAGAPGALVAPVLKALARGMSVTVVEPDRAVLVPFLRSVAARQEAAVQAGRLAPERRDGEWARLLPQAEAEALSHCDLVIASEGAAVPDRGGTVLMLGRGPLPPRAFRLVLSGRVAELGIPDGAVGPAAAKALAFLRRLGLVALTTGVQSSLGLSGRLAGASGAAVRALVALGVDPAAVTGALTGFGLPAPVLPEPAGTPFLPMSDDEIVHRWLSAVVNEGVRLLAVGMAHSAGEIDLVAVHGMGFPRARGGPMHQALRRGLLIMRRDLSFWTDEADVWRPVPAWDRLVAAGRGFDAV